MADDHFVVEKSIKNGVTSISVKKVKDEEKEEALALLLAPEKKSKDTAKQYAKSLIDNAEKFKEKELV